MRRDVRRGAVGLLLVLVALAVTACRRAGDSASSASTVADSRTSPAQWVITPETYGPVRFGEPLDDAGDAIGEPLTASYDDEDSCAFVRPRTFPAGVTLMVEYDTVERVDVEGTGVRTSAGAAVGDPEARVLSLYRGQVQVQPHKYSGPAGHYLVVTPPGDTAHRLIFETDGQRVVGYRAGRRPAVEYVEGCG